MAKEYFTFAGFLGFLELFWDFWDLWDFVWTFRIFGIFLGFLGFPQDFSDFLGNFSNFLDFFGLFGFSRYLKYSLFLHDSAYFLFFLVIGHFSITEKREKSLFRKGPFKQLVRLNLLTFSRGGTICPFFSDPWVIPLKSCLLTSERPLHTFFRKISK